MTEPKAYIFIGRSGSGKGTQVELLIKKLKLDNPESNFFYAYTGEQFRAFIKQENYSAGLARAINTSGGRQPDFLAVKMWADLMVNNLRGGEFIIFDGSPRSVLEAEAMDTALNFYNYRERRVIHLDVGLDCAVARLTGRGRQDDSVAAIKKRLVWFDRDVVPAIDYYRQNKNYRLLEVNGEQDVEAIHQEILKHCCD